MRRIVVFVSLLLWACTGPEAPRDRSLESLPVLSPELQERIGSLDDPEVGFTRVTGLDADSEGNLYVLESSVPEIRVFSPERELLRRIGGRGEGPGEFQRSPQFGLRGDTIWTIDNGQRRITLFDLSGEVLSASAFPVVRVPLPDGVFGHIQPRVLREDGSFLGHLTSIYRNRDARTEVEPTDSIPVPWVRFGIDGTVIDTLGWAAKPPPRMWRPPSETRYDPEFIEVGGQRKMVPRPPSDLGRQLHLPDGYVSLTAPQPEGEAAPTIRLTRVDVSRDTVYHTELTYEPVPYTDDVLDTIAARAARGEPGGMVPFSPRGNVVPDNWKGIASRLRERMDFPEYRGAMAYGQTTRADGVWIKLRSGNDPTARWVVVDPEGKPVGTVELPADARLLRHYGAELWVSEPDEFDVPWLVRYRLSGQDR